MADKSNHISAESNLKLRWFFGGRGNVFESSNSGAQIEQLWAANVARFKCPVCDGDGYLYCGAAHAKPCSRCNAEGEIERNMSGTMVPRSGYVRCNDCHGAVGFNRSCEFCHGEGFASTDAAFCHHEDQAIMYADGDAALFTRQGEMVRAMDRLDDSRKALASRYFGPEGDRWARTRRGRLFSLYDCTAAGRKLLTGSPKAHRRLTPLEHIGMLAESDQRFPERERTQLLANAYLQARELFEQFEADWQTAIGCAQ